MNREPLAMPLDTDSMVRMLLAHRAMVLGYIASILRDATLAEDVFQDVALIVLRKGGEAPSEEAFPAWVRRIARFESLNALRRRRRAPAPLEAGLLDELDPHWDAGDAVAPSSAVEAMRSCLGQLPPRSRLMIELRYRDGLAGRGLADRLSLTLNTAYVALSRVHRALSKCIRGFLSGREAQHA